MDKVVTYEEIQEVIGSMKSETEPGPDGFTSKFYEIFQKELIPKLQILANNILNGYHPPRTWQEALISMIPKTDHKAPSVKDFRPISLLNTDYKIFSKITADRLKKTMGKFIMEDQAGFLPNHYIKDSENSARHY